MRRAPSVAVLAALALSAAASADAPPEALRARLAASPAISAAALEAVDAADRVRVLVAFAAPEALRDARRGPARAPGPAARALRSRLVAQVEARRVALLRDLDPAEVQVERTFGSVPALVARATARGLALLAEHPDVRHVDLVAPVRALVQESVPLVELDHLHASGLDGTGSVVAVVDTGVDATHPEFDGAVVAEHCICTSACCPGGVTEADGPGSAQDDHGHGTSVAGVVAADGSLIGGAPGASIVAVKVLNASGSGTVEDVVDGLDWLVTSAPAVDVVNLSLGSGSYTGDCDNADANTMAYADAVDALRAVGVLTVAATGNDGSGSTMDAPACVSGSVSVGAVWDEDLGSQTVLGCTDPTTAPDQVTCYSNSNDHTDLFAPGSRIRTLKSGGTKRYVNGTSFAAPFAAACAGVLRGARPLATPDDLEEALRTSNVTVTDSTNMLGFPRLDCQLALAALGPAAVPALPAWAGAVLAALLAVVARGARAAPGGGTPRGDGAWNRLFDSARPPRGFLSRGLAARGLHRLAVRCRGRSRA